MKLNLTVSELRGLLSAPVEAPGASSRRDIQAGAASLPELGTSIATYAATADPVDLMRLAQFLEESAASIWRALHAATREDEPGAPETDAGQAVPPLGADSPTSASPEPLASPDASGEPESLNPPEPPALNEITVP